VIDAIKPPTDSLYKFLAICGLLLFVSSLTTPVWYANKFTEQQLTLLRDAKILNANTKPWQLAADEMRTTSARSQLAAQRYLEALKKAIKKEISESELKAIGAEADKAGEEFQQAGTTLVLKVTEWEKEYAQVQYQYAMLEHTRDNVHIIFRVASVGAFVGLILMVSGFVFWYKRIQKYEDLLLKNKVEKTETNS
jgi:hypothetical protein